MSDSSSTPFDDGVVAEAAATHDLPVSDLRDALEGVQELADRHIGVDGLVYDWRGSFREDPLVDRTADEWRLVVETGVWRDFADRCDLDRATLRAVMAVHAAHVDARIDADELPLGDPMVLARP